MEHHAFCYVGFDFARLELDSLFSASNPDIHIEEYVDFGIQEARALRLRASLLPAVSPTQIFVIVATNIHSEAQNALLKLFEEPPQRTQFYLVVPKRGLLLSTLQSRLHFMEDEDVQAPTDSSGYIDFLGASYGERLALVGKITKEKDVEMIDEILLGAEKRASADKNQSLLTTVLFVRQHIGVRGASAKMLLESLALALPLPHK